MQAMNKNQRRNKRGSSIVETCAGLFVVIPILLFFMDVGYVLLGQMANDALAKEAARAAAETATLTLANTAAQNVVTNYFNSQDSMFISPPSGDPALVIVSPADIQYNPTVAGVQSGVVIITTHISCRMPVPFPGLANPLSFSAVATEPIVALLPTN